MATRSSAGWVILVAALAVPGFLFYNWWTHLNNESRKQLSVKVRNRLPPGTSMFGQPSPAQDKLSNPIAAQDALAAPAAPTAPALSTATVVAAAPPAADAQAREADAVAPPQSPAVVEGVVRIGTIAQIVLTRDPMLSPSDVARIQEEESRARLAEAGVAPAAPRPVRRTKAVEATLDLQGIVSTAEGDKAIVNGEIVGEGDFIRGVKVVKITPNGVVFLYRNKRFIKGMSQ